MITILSGTNRPASQTLRVAQFFSKAFSDIAAKNQILDLGQLPKDLMDPQSFANKPKDFEKFSEAILESDGLVVVTPEYNGSFPGVLKLFIDHLKFPESFENRCVAFVGLSAGMWGALRSVEQLQMIFSYRNARLFNERIFLPRVETQFDENGNLKTPLTRDLAQSFVTNFSKFVEKNK